MRQVLKKISLNKSKHVPTGFTQHYKDGMTAETPSILQIEIISNEPQDKGYIYLIYYDSDMNEITDTLHETVDDAMKQASLEFNVDEKDWRE